MKSGGRIIMIGSCVGERALTPGLVAYSATKGAVKMFTQGLSRGREPGYHGQQRPAGSDRHGFESRRGRVGGASEGRHSARPLWAC
jgi:short chain dehydrogenase